MSFLEAVRSALLTLRSQKLRTVLTLFGMVWGTASVVFLMSWGLGVQQLLEEGFNRAGKNFVQVWAGKIGEDFTPAVDRRLLWFTRDDVAALRAQSRYADLVLGESRDWMPVASRQKMLTRDVRGIEPELFEMRDVEMAAGRPLSRVDLALRRRVAVVGDKTRHELLGPDARIGQTIRIDGTPYEVVGFLAPVGTELWRNGAETDEQVWIPLSTLLASGLRYGRDDDVVDAIQLHLSERRHYDDLRQEIRSILARRLGVSASDDEALIILSPIDMLRKLPIDAIHGLLLILATTTLGIGGIGILNLMLDSVQERRQEIGVRLAVGARRRDVLGQFFLETFVITGLGGLLGLGLGLLGCWALARIDAPDLIPVPILKAEVVWLAILVMSGVGLGSGLLPAWRAAGIEPSLTLRAE